MNIKSLLIGSAAVLAASTGAKAADAIVMADPEPMEYVRVCDVYGSGFFYIPGTETCMRIGGYVRTEVRYNAPTSTTVSGPYLQINAAGTPVSLTGITRTYTNPGGASLFARFAPTFDVRTETEMGTVRGFAELEIDYGWGAAAMPISAASLAVGTIAPGAVFPSGVRGGAYAQSVNLNHAFIEIASSAGTFRIGKGDTPYARFLGYGSGNSFGGQYGFSNTSEISYTFRGGNGFSAIIALVADTDGDWMPDVHGGINFAQGWGSVGAIASYDESTGNFAAKGVVRFKAPNGSFSGGMHVLYASGPHSNAAYSSLYGAAAAAGGLPWSQWSVLGHVKGQLTQTVAATASVQWFSFRSGWEIVGGFDITPFGANEAGGGSTLRIRPEIRYATDTSGNAWSGLVRVDRNF